MRDPEEMGCMSYVLFCVVLSLGVALGNEFIVKRHHLDRTASLLLLVVWLVVVVYAFWKIGEYKKKAGN